MIRIGKFSHHVIDVDAKKKRPTARLRAAVPTVHLAAVELETLVLACLLNHLQVKRQLFDQESCNCHRHAVTRKALPAIAFKGTGTLLE